MGETLTMADQMRAYVLSDRGTYLRFRDKIDLVPLVAPSDLLLNPYGVLQVDPLKNVLINGELAGQFIDFLIDHRTQRMIADFRIGGEALFEPLRLPQEQ